MLIEVSDLWISDREQAAAWLGPLCFPQVRLMGLGKAGYRPLIRKGQTGYKAVWPSSKRLRSSHFG